MRSDETTNKQVTCGCCGASNASDESSKQCIIGKRVHSGINNNALPRNPQKSRLGMLATLEPFTEDPAERRRHTLHSLSLLVVPGAAGGDFLVPAAHRLRPSWYSAGATSCCELNPHAPTINALHQMQVQQHLHQAFRHIIVLRAKYCLCRCPVISQAQS